MAWLTDRGYGAILGAVAPLLPLYLKWRVRKGKELPERLAERYGHSTIARPQGTLLWFHGASVGEGMSALPLIERLCELNPGLSILFTSGTVASATLIGKRLPLKGIHQFVPLDVPRYARRFLDHWRPDAAIWLESELWPGMLSEMRVRGIPAIRLNARLTAKSAAGWSKAAPWFKTILSSFKLSLAIAEADAQRLQAAGAPNVLAVGNLKFTAPVPRVDETSLAALKSAIGTRPVWLMASSHPGEEDMALRLHNRLAAHYPDLLTIIAPRHPRRGDEVEALLHMPHARRSRGDALNAGHAVYLADTMGEMAMLYRASGLVMMGGSFTPKGGHNPIEPAQCSAATLIGPDTSKCADITAELVNAGALIQVEDENAAFEQLNHLLQDEAARKSMQEAGLRATRQQERIMSATLGSMAQVLNQLGVRTA